MEDTTIILFMLSLFVTLMMMGISYLTYKRHKDEGLLNSTELWASLAFNSIIMWTVAMAPIEYIALSMVGWIWPANVIKTFIEKHSGKSLEMKFAYMGLAIGGFVSLALATFGESFVVYTIPYCLALGGLGLYLVTKACLETPSKTALTWTFYVTAGLFFVENLAFPWWRTQPDFVMYSSALDLSIYFLFAASTVSLCLEQMKRSHEQELETLVKERNQKLYGQSK